MGNTRRGRFLFLTGLALLGYYLGFLLPEERKNRVKKLLNESVEMPFRLFV